MIPIIFAIHSPINPIHCLHLILHRPKSIILLMQALIIGSRSINQDQFFQKEVQEKYNRHISYVKSINTDKNYNLHDWQSGIESLASTLRKSKSAAKIFREKECNSQVRHENMHLLKKIWNLQPAVKTYHQDRYQYISGSNWSQHQKKLSEIKLQNQRNEKQLLLKQHLEKQEYKKKLKQEILQYEELRDSIRKCKGKDLKTKRSQSDRKVSAGLKLKKIDSQENLPKEPINQHPDAPESPELQQSKEIKLL